MIERARNLLNWLRGRLWLLPALMSLVAVGLAYVLLVPGAGVQQAFASVWWLYGGDAGTARDLLATLLSGMITMTALVVSITMVVLSLAANQLGPRLIWNFIEDRRIQAVIGLFVATILYILIVLRSIEEELGVEGVPHLAVTVASVLAAACLFALLFLVNILAHSIISDTVVRHVADALESSVRQLPEDDAPASSDSGPESVYAHRWSGSLGERGYIQVIDYEALRELACKHDLLIALHVRAGYFVLRGTEHFEIKSSRPIADEWVEAVRKSIIVGAGRTPTQDLEYSIRQLVEVALRALSPSLNDPFTAIAVIDRLAAALELAMSRSLQQMEHRDDSGRLRVLANATEYGGLVDVAFDQIRQAARSNPAVLIELGKRLGDLLHVAASAEQSQALLRHVQMLERTAQDIPEVSDRDDLLTVIGAAKRECTGGKIRGLTGPRRGA